MICEKCKKDFPEPQLQSSHDVPCYLFWGKDRRDKKNQADKFGRHWLCIKCHKDYEDKLNISLKKYSQKFASKFFREYDDNSI